MKSTIMVVDDEDDIRELVITSLKRYYKDINFIEAADGQECLDLLEKGVEPNLILLDIMMPKMNGWDVVHELTERGINVPKIFFTAKTDDLSKELGQSVAQDYIEKPFDIKDLVSRISKYL